MSSSLKIINLLYKRFKGILFMMKYNNDNLIYDDEDLVNLKKKVCDCFNSYDNMQWTDYAKISEKEVELIGYTKFNDTERIFFNITSHKNYLYVITYEGGEDFQIDYYTNKETLYSKVDFDTHR